MVSSWESYHCVFHHEKLSAAHFICHSIIQSDGEKCDKK